MIDYEKLKKEQEPKYKKAWYIGKGYREIKCTKVLNAACYQMCDETDLECLGKVMYPSKQALIDAQIEHWQSQKDKIQSTENCSESIKKHHELIEECEHESDGMCFLTNPPQYKCCKCGELFK